MLHVICSMLGVIAMCLLAVSGVMLTHPDGFDVDSSTSSERTGTIAAQVVKRGDKGEIGRTVRRALPGAGAVEAVEESGEADSRTYRVILTRPNCRFDGEADNAGRVKGTWESYGAKGALVNLHRSRFADSLRWRILMDVGAGCLLLACLTGIILWLGTKARRILGLAAFVIGLAAYVGGYLWLIP
jgi:hypothetical protein